MPTSDKTKEWKTFEYMAQETLPLTLVTNYFRKMLRANYRAHTPDMSILSHAICIASNTIPPKSNMYREEAVNADA